MQSKSLLGIGFGAGLLGPALLMADASELIIVLAFLGLLVVGLVLQTRAGIHAWRSGASPFRRVFEATAIYWGAASVGIVLGVAIAFTAVFSLDPGFGLAQGVLALPMLWLIAVVCAGVVGVVTTAARAAQSR
jgi:hypothetical protein